MCDVYIYISYTGVWNLIQIIFILFVARYKAVDIPIYHGQGIKL